MEAESWDRIGDSLLALGRDREAHDAWQHALEIYDEHSDPAAEQLRERISAARAPGQRDEGRVVSRTVRRH